MHVDLEWAQTPWLIKVRERDTHLTMHMRCDMPQKAAASLTDKAEVQQGCRRA